MSTTESAIDYGDTDDVGFEVTDEVDVGDLSDQTGNEAIEKASKVRFEIKKASVRPYVKQGESAWRKKFLALELVVGPLGVDGEGRYANKHFFEDLLLVANVSDFPDLATEHYKTKARFPVKQFLKAMGFDPTAPPRINDDFLGEMLSREVVADIQKKEIQTPPTEEGGKWVGTGEYKNVIANFRSAE